MAKDYFFPVAMEISSCVLSINTSEKVQSIIILIILIPRESVDMQAHHLRVCMMPIILSI